jgi:cysteate synthase
VGSGTGAIAAWEANMRLIGDGRFGSVKMKLRLSQNAPFLLMHDTWKERSRDLVVLDSDLARRQVSEIDAKVLSNRRPPWALMGGLYDAMEDTSGEFYGMTNSEAAEAASLFLEKEGVDISPAASVAAASFLKAAADGEISPESVVMLNITGGGMELFKSSRKMHYLKPDLIFPIEYERKTVEEKIPALFL